MRLQVTFAQWQSVVAAVDPKLHQTMLYAANLTPAVTAAGIVESELACDFTGTYPTEVAFLAAFPDAVKVNQV